VCEARALADPAAQSLTHRAYSFLAAARFSLLPGPADTLSAAQECGALLAFVQLSVTVVVPALVQAALEAGLFMQHQVQRQQLDLLVEGGMQVRLYDTIRATAEACDWPVAAAALWVLLGLLWDLSVLLVAGRQAGG